MPGLSIFLCIYYICCSFSTIQILWILFSKTREIEVMIEGMYVQHIWVFSNHSTIDVKNPDMLYWMLITIFTTVSTVGWGTKPQCFRPPSLKTWFFYVVFNAELNGPIRILCFHGSARPSWTTVNQWCCNGNIKLWWCHSIQH